ncbi:hypothetical protein OUZ56_029591 [Daphnia magna]|uniref:Uncharacterized protein n=1 Tax=Daphnia magna TaxID=35525 RepID=A0ABR0B798_9CRUS|nr:hypothetical protein OUZ56_029591 [Daphnia magna]
MYGRIDEYIRTINRPPSAISRNPESDTRTIHIHVTWAKDKQILDPRFLNFNQLIVFASFSVLSSFTLTSHDVTVIKIIAFCTDCNALTVVRLRKQKRIDCLGFGNQLESNEKTTIPRIKF